MEVFSIGDLMDQVRAAAALGVKPQTLAVWRCTHRYNLPYVKIGRRVMYRRSDLEAFVNSNLICQEAA